MTDPIDWPAFGMPEGAEIRFRRGLGGIRVWDYRPGSASIQLRAHPPLWRGDSDWWCDVDGSGQSADFPILEAFMRAARAIEAGEVELP